MASWEITCTQWRFFHWEHHPIGNAPGNDERRVQEEDPPVKSWFITQSKCRHIHLNPNCELILNQLLTLKSPLYHIYIYIPIL